MSFSVSGFFGRSLVRPWFLPGLLPEREREGTREENLENCNFYLSKSKIIANLNHLAIL